MNRCFNLGVGRDFRVALIYFPHQASLHFVASLIEDVQILLVQPQRWEAHYPKKVFLLYDGLSHMRLRPQPCDFLWELDLPLGPQGMPQDSQPDPEP